MTFSENARWVAKTRIENKQILINYVRNDKGQKVGTVVAIPEYDQIDTHLGTFTYPIPSSVRVGYSRWNPKDKYDKYAGIYVALRRALDRDCTEAPYYDRMKARAERYFLKNKVQNDKNPSFT